MPKEVVTDKTSKDQEAVKIIISEPKTVVGEFDNDFFEQNFAGFFQRFAARLIDLGLYLLLTLVVSYFIISPLVINQSGLNQAKLAEYSTILTNTLSDKLSTGELNFAEVLKQTSDTSCDQIFQSNNDNQSLCNQVNGLNEKSNFAQAIIMFIISVAYFVFSAISKWQGSLGKRLFRLQIVNAGGGKINLLQSFAREAFWIAQGLFAILVLFYPPAALLYTLTIFVIIADCLKIFFSKQKQTIHDNIADTYVIKSDHQI